ncbi:flagellar biosynthesis protein FlhA [Silvibacterium bohemicum]|uniref:Flagellar biosynthesis protein FlhA n=1 Tax=Silvibacterium bohemicum TaxID=1577686 RepID=A0A841JUD6_9BACT|nr:flagellar biosynthesis protein FlhA [Silvibacterium bohemicum]MBB6145013.1 flagellar biosynthesis protein FlhA [Silvibacterium bohemicum]
MNKKSGLLNSLRTSSEWVIPTAAVALVFVMLVPLPSFILDMLLTLNIVASVLVLLTAIQILRPVEFSVFPSLILLLTLMRLSLDLASTRRILLHGNEGPSAAGKVIEAFGQFVVGGNYIVGFVIFIALIAIQYLVVSHGAVRTAEVTARFTLDAMPGKQMAIDSDLNTGLITADVARTRREAVSREAEFCGSMDGAARFSQRDSLATILIMAINIVAGFLIGVFQQGVPFAQALKTYTILTVGDGLVAIIPSLLVSVAGGIVVTRAASDRSLGVDITKQVFRTSRPLWIVSGVLVALALIPGMPKIAFLALGGATMYAASKMKPAAATDAVTAKGAAGKGAVPGAPSIDPMDAVLKLDELMLEVGIGLVPLVDAKQGGQLLARVKSLRKNLAQQLGFLVPSIHITDNLSLKEREYVVYLRGVEIARWEMRRDRLLAVNSNPKPGDIPGQETREPAFDSPAKWITPDLQAQAISAGYAVVDHTAVLAAHLAELIKQNAHDLLTRSETKRLVDRIGDSHPKLVEELTPKLMSLGEIQKVLQQLLREQVSIRDIGSILEALVETAAINKNPVALVESARHSLGRALIRPLLNERGQLKVVTLDSSIEEECSRTQNPQLIAGGAMQISVARRVLDGLRSMLGDQVTMAPPVLLCASPGRFYLKRLLEPFIPKIVVISPSEIPPMTQVQSLGSVR